MTETNPQNYIGATLTIVGYAASAPRSPLYDKDGSKGVLELPIPINEGYKKDGDWVQTGTTWYQYVAGGSGADDLRDIGIQKGDKVRIDGAKQEVREYQDKEGNNRLGINLRFGTITVLEQADPVEEAPF